MDPTTTPVNRRSLITGLAGAAALPFLAGAGLTLGTAPVRAAADKLGASKPSFYRFNLGSFEVTTLLDGTRPADGPQTIFGTDQTPETVGSLLEANFLPKEKFVNGFTPTLINTGKELVLFDTGLGEKARPDLGNLSDRIRAAGYSPEQIDIVVITHMHPDHIGGVMAGGAPAFANARYVTGAREFDFWTKDAAAGPMAEMSKSISDMMKPLAEKTTFLDDGGSVVSGITGMAAPGHTPGHMIYNLESDGRRLVITADTANHYVLSLQKPDWEVKFDADKPTAAKTRKTVFGMLAADKVPFIGYHMPFPSVGYVEPMGDGFRYVPASYQLDL